jgi:hypothetical protein
VDTRQLAARLQAAPGLAKFLTDAAKAPVAKDDAANLSALEWGLTGHWENGHLVTAPAPLRAFRDALRQQDYITLAGKEASGFTLSGEEKAQLQDLEQKYGGEKDYGADHLWSKAYLGLGKLTPYLAGDIVFGAAGSFTGAAIAGATGAEAGAAGGAAVGAVGGGVGAAPGAAVGAVGGGVATGVPGALAGGLVGTSVWNFYQNFGPQYRQLRRLTDSDGKPLLSENEARTYAGTASLLSAGLMAGAGGFVLGKIPAVKSLLGRIGADAVSKALAQQTVARTLAVAPLKVGLTATAGGMMMAAQAAANAGSEEIAKATHGQDASGQRVWDASTDAFQKGIVDMAALTAFGAGREFLHDMGRAQLLQEQSRRFQAEVEASEKSRLLTRSPELFEEAHQLAQGEAPQTRSIAVEAWDRYWQVKKIDPAQMAARVMGDGGKSYAEAAAGGGDLSIPAEKFISNFANTEHIAGLREDLRLSPDAPTLREAREAHEALQAKAKEEANAPRTRTRLQSR